jgi:hypothetical protein
MAMQRALFVVIAVTGCSYPEFAFQPAATDAEATRDAELDSETVDSTAPDTTTGDTTASDTTNSDTTTGDTLVADVIDTGPTCKLSLDCPCGEYCSAGKCVPSTDCTKDAHYCPGGVTCKCIAGRWDISGTTSPAAAALVPAQPVTVTDNGADLMLRNYSIHDTSGTQFAMRIRPANCTSDWYYRNINIQCVDFAALNAPSARAVNISRKGDPIGCRPSVAPELLLDRVNIVTGDSYSFFEDVEFSRVTLRKVSTKGSGILIAAWGPGNIGQLVVEDSPDLYTELQGKVPVVTVKSSPRYRWWASSPTETRDATWPLITITYDKSSCPTRTLTNTSAIKEICLAT